MDGRADTAKWGGPLHSLKLTSAGKRVPLSFGNWTQHSEFEWIRVISQFFSAFQLCHLSDISVAARFCRGPWTPQRPPAALASNPPSSIRVWLACQQIILRCEHSNENEEGMLAALYVCYVMVVIVTFCRNPSPVGLHSVLVGHELAA
jgi:hypothetical protein